MAITGTELCTRAFQLIGRSVPGEVPNTTDLTAALVRANSILDSWSIQEEMAVAAVTVPFTLTADIGTYNQTIRIARVVSASFELASGSGSSYPLEILDAPGFNNINDKLAKSVRPGAIFYDGGFPTGAINVVPIPLNSGGVITYIAWGAFTQFASLATSVTLYPGYEEALTAELAVRLCPLFLKTPSPELLDMRKSAMNEVRTLNSQLWGSRRSVKAMR